MELSKQIIAKRVVSIYDGAYVGTIYGALADRQYKKIVALAVFDDNDEEYTLKPKDIYGKIGDALLIKNKRALLPIANQISPVGMPIFLGKPCFSLNGQALGKITDIILDDDFKIERVSTEKENFTPEQILNDGKVVIIKENNSNIRLRHFRPKLPKPAGQNQAVQIQNPTIAPEISVVPQNIVTTPARVTVNTDSLLGRRATKTIYGINNEIIVKNNGTITEKVLIAAQSHGKLNEIAISSRRR